MSGFHHSVAVLPLPFRRSTVVNFRCSLKLRKKIPFRYSRKQQKDTQRHRKRQRQRLTGTAKRQRKNGNGMMETGHKWAFFETQCRKTILITGTTSLYVLMRCDAVHEGDKNNAL